MSMILHERRDSQRINAVFDVYRDNSNKNPEREREERLGKLINSETSRQITRYINGGNSCPIPRINRS